MNPKPGVSRGGRRGDGLEDRAPRGDPDQGGQVVGEAVPMSPEQPGQGGAQPGEVDPGVIAVGHLDEPRGVEEEALEGRFRGQVDVPLEGGDGPAPPDGPGGVDDEDVEGELPEGVEPDDPARGQQVGRPRPQPAAPGRSDQPAEAQEGHATGAQAGGEGQG